MTHMSAQDKIIPRLRRKLKERDQRIAGLERRIAQLETALANKDFEVRRLPIEVTRAVQEALCNVRLIPALGIGKTNKIIEVKVTDAPG